LVLDALVSNKLGNKIVGILTVQGYLKMESKKTVLLNIHDLGQVESSTTKLSVIWPHCFYCVAKLFSDTAIG